MSNTSSKLSLPYIQANQAQKHVTHNEALRTLDTVVQLSVVASDERTPPADPAAGDRYVVAVNPTNDWIDAAGKIAVWDENNWQFLDPQQGWTAWDQTAKTLIVYDGEAWETVEKPLQNLEFVGVNTTADDTNRLAVFSDATLLSHDVAGDHQLKINKETATATASLLYQTDWSARAEMGTTGSDNFEIKVSPDGSTFYQAMVIDQSTGEVTFPNTDLGGSEFGDSPLLTVEYMAAKGNDLVANGTGFLGNNYNMPSAFTFDAAETPNTAGSFQYKGRYDGTYFSDEFIAVNPNKIYRLSAYLKQEALAGDWSAYSNGDRHLQYMGVVAYDLDKNPIYAMHHMRHKSGSIDSLTTLAAPLTPGDTTITLTDATGWNDSEVASYKCGIIIFEYKNSYGKTYDHYSRLFQFDLFDISGVDKQNNVVTLKKPLPAALANPDDPNGTWPVGARIANSSSGGTYKYPLLSGQVLSSSGDWYAVENHMGGVDLSGSNAGTNFPPGTAYLKLMWIPNHSNRSGGYSNFPDTGPDHKVWFTGISMTPEHMATTQRAADGRVNILVPHVDFNTASLSIAPPSRKITLI